MHDTKAVSGFAVNPCSHAPQVVSAEEADMADRGGAKQPLGQLKSDTLPFCLTCAIIEDRLIADPTDQEESLAAATVSVVVDGQGNLVGAWHSSSFGCQQLEALCACQDGWSLGQSISVAATCTKRA